MKINVFQMEEIFFPTGLLISGIFMWKVWKSKIGILALGRPHLMFNMQKKDWLRV